MRRNLYFFSATEAVIKEMQSKQHVKRNQPRPSTKFTGLMPKCDIDILLYIRFDIYLYILDAFNVRCYYRTQKYGLRIIKLCLIT